MSDTCIGIIGGSGLENPDLFQIEHEWQPQTAYGMPSSSLRRGKLQGKNVVFLSRHGKDHSILPSAVNYRANIAALHEAGCTHILASAACGSLNRAYAPGDLVLINQFIDWTRHRISTFYGMQQDSNARFFHTAMPDPFDATLQQILRATAVEQNIRLHDGATLITIEGPRFSTRAESRMFQSWGADLVNMTIATEAALAAEKHLPYAVVGIVTDYDSWNEEAPPLQVETLLATFVANAAKLTALFLAAIRHFSARSESCP